MKLISAVCMNVALVFSQQSFNYEKINHFGLGRRIIPRIDPRRSYPIFDSEGHPSPIPPAKRRNFASARIDVVIQGVRKKGDKLMYRQDFDLPEKVEGQQMFFRGTYTCILSRLIVHTEQGIATLLRGGVGYKHFTAVVRAPAGRKLTGHVRAYCPNGTDYYSILR